MLTRPSNHPRNVITRRAHDAIRDNGGSTRARVFYKYDCSGCGRRVRVVEPDVLPSRAQCDACHAWTSITVAGFALQVRADEAVSWGSDGLFVRKPYAHLPAQSTASEFER